MYSFVAYAIVVIAVGEIISADVLWSLVLFGIMGVIIGRTAGKKHARMYWLWPLLCMLVIHVVLPISTTGRNAQDYFATPIIGLVMGVGSCLPSLFFRYGNYFLRSK